MTRKKTTEENRILAEMQEMAQSLQGHGLISKQDMARMNLSCQSPPQSSTSAFLRCRNGSRPDQANTRAARQRSCCN